MKGPKKGFHVQEGGFLWGSWDSSWPRRGGVPVQEGGSCGVPVALAVHTLPSQFLAGFHFKCNAKAVANFLASVVRVTPYWDLEMHGERDGNTFTTLWALCLEMTTSLCAQPVTV